MKQFGGITLRVALLGWLVSLVTLAVFIGVIVPQQKEEFQMNLESKARGVAASIKAVAAGAAVSEDYSVVVDQAMQVLSGDEAIDFLVISKNDGFSVVTDRASWRTEELGAEWRPQVRKAGSSIGTVPLFGRRLFHYRTPFDYSGIEWGWVHVGLSLKTYDESVARSVSRTVGLTILCGLLSLLVSLLYAQHLVKPIHALHTAVERLADGDLEARADVISRDEIGRLAGAFNSMTATIQARNRVLESVGYAAQQLLLANEWSQAIDGILESVGRATGTSRAYVFENEVHQGRLYCSLRHEWLAKGVQPSAGRWQRFPWDGGGLECFAEQLRNNIVVTTRPDQLDTTTRAILDPNLRSLLLIPVVVGDTWWGFLGFDDCAQEREWGEVEKESLRAVANMLGSTLLRDKAQAALVEAKNTLERRVIERTQELQEQVTARERANAELAAAQQRLVDLSRQAGMAEVATGVLHNVGNVLNSVNVTTTLVLEKLRQSRIDKLAAVVSLLREHADDLETFLRQDQKGSHVVPYLTKLSDHLARERDGMLLELANLSRHVGHIKEIVAAQQGYATTAGFVERVSLHKLMEDAIALSKDGLERHGVILTVETEQLPDVHTDKHKVLQILLNLVRNAKDATKVMEPGMRKVWLHAGLTADNSVSITVRDNGVGLQPEQLQRIFQHGFTTKEGGHGFGLHSGALAARDLGGKLTVHSDGPGLGATFALELPLRVQAKMERTVTR